MAGPAKRIGTPNSSLIRYASSLLCLFSGRAQKIMQGVVFVVAQYRLGSLGFFALPGNPSLAGNFGLKDQQEALRWLQVHISTMLTLDGMQVSVSKFGGDPSRVTIFGSGSGAVSVHAHILSPQGDGLFQVIRLWPEIVSFKFISS